MGKNDDVFILGQVKLMDLNDGCQRRSFHTGLPLSPPVQCRQSVDTCVDCNITAISLDINFGTNLVISDPHDGI